jgi:type 2 lantibiotic biosynthesis protein LanM
MKKIIAPSQHLWQHVAWHQALTIEERIASMDDQRKDHPEIVQVRNENAWRQLQAWKAQIPFDQGSYFADRLAQLSITEEQLLALLAESSQDLQARTSSVSAWLTTLTEALEDAHTDQDFDLPTQMKGQHLAVCLYAIMPLVKQGIKRLEIGIQTLTQQYSYLPFDPHVAIEALSTNLSNTLLSQIMRTLVLEMHVARIREELQGETPVERFTTFMRQLGQPEKLMALLEEYPVLARQIITTIEQWTNYSLEFLTHLCADWHDICTTFLPQEEPGLLMQIHGGAGDSHRRGRSVLLLQFASGWRLLYKPRSLSVDVHFQELLTWLNERGASPPLRTIKLLERDHYGWSEYMQEASCSTKGEVERFYERQGSYLALLYALDATDFHAENVIAAGEYPMLVDLEALFHPHMHGVDLTEPDALAIQTIGYSVLRIGLLPHRIWSNDQAVGIDLSGLGGQEGQRTPWPIARWQEPGTDQMHLVREHVKIQGSQNRPKLNNNAVNLLDYSEHIVVGFQRMYRLLMAEKEALLTEQLPRFAYDEVRLIVRPTKTYAKLLSESFHPDLQRNALERTCFFDRLWANIVQQPYLVNLIPTEQRALWRGDVPMFTTFPDSRAVFTDEGEHLQESFFDESSLEVVSKRIQKLDQHDLEKQLWLIQASLAIFLMSSDDEFDKAIYRQPAQVHSHQTTPYRTCAKEAALGIGKRLMELALRNEQGTGWVGIIMGRDEQWDLLPADESLYNGTAGIALFLAYLGALSDNDEITQLARSAVATVRFRIEQQKKYEQQVIGGFEGLGSAIYLYTHLAVLWNDPSFLQEAEEIVDFLLPYIDKDEHLDILAGTAGCILSLLTLYSVAPSSHTLQAALQCGNHLLATAHPAQVGLGWLKPGETMPLTGFSHGVSGIALSLLALADLSGEERFREAAQQAIAYERSLFSSHERNWPDLRTTKEVGDQPPEATQTDHFMVAWCHGAPGIALSRIEALHYGYVDASIHEEIEVALKTTMEQGFQSNHSLCHGSLGNLEAFLRAQQVLGNPVYQEQVKQLATMLLDHIETHGCLTGVPRGLETPGLMMGLAGIGYELLRLAEPEQVPSVLLLAPPRNTHN